MHLGRVLGEGETKSKFLKNSLLCGDEIEEAKVKAESGNVREMGEAVRFKR